MTKTFADECIERAEIDLKFIDISEGEQKDLRDIIELARRLQKACKQILEMADATGSFTAQNRATGWVKELEKPMEGVGNESRS